MRVEILCPYITEAKASSLGLVGKRGCRISDRPAYLKLYGKKMEKTFLKEVYVCEKFSLYTGPLSLVFTAKEWLEAGKIPVSPLVPEKRQKEKPITEKQRRFLLELMSEVGERYPIPGSRKDASLLIDYLKSLKRRKRKVA